VRLLCVSDIHGQADALAAVFATAERRGYTHLLVAGDLCFPGPKPLDTWRRLVQAKAICVQGASDRALSTLNLDRITPRSDHERERIERVRQVRAELGELILARLARLSPTYRIPFPDGRELVLVHGSPADPLEPLTHDMTDEEILSLLGDDPADVVVCGGSHVPFHRVIGDVHIVNVGSVGEAPSGVPDELDAPADPGFGAEGAVGRPGAPSFNPGVEAERSPRAPRHADATFIEIRDGFLEVAPFVVPLGRAAAAVVPAKAIAPQD
jgi:predicted phosphodiesterase